MITGEVRLFKQYYGNMIMYNELEIPYGLFSSDDILHSWSTGREPGLLGADCRREFESMWECTRMDAKALREVCVRMTDIKKYV